MPRIGPMPEEERFENEEEALAYHGAKKEWELTMQTCGLQPTYPDGFWPGWVASRQWRIARREAGKS